MGMARDEGAGRGEAHASGIDPLAVQAANLLAKAMVTTHDRDLLWERFHELVVDQTRELEEAPIRAALDEMERQGVRLEAVARVVRDRMGG
jgi:hypothetical protein